MMSFALNRAALLVRFVEGDPHGLREAHKTFHQVAIVRPLGIKSRKRFKLSIVLTAAMLPCMFQYGES